MNLRIALLLLPFAVSASAWALSDADKAAEAELWAKEEVEDEKMKMNPNAKTAFEGSVSLNEAVEAETGIVGTFTIGGKAHLLRMETPALYNELKKVNGKTVTLTGKVRVSGKYFVAQSVLVPTPGIPRKSRSKRGGG